LLGAVAAGVRLVGGDWGGGSEVRAGCGRLFPRGDAMSLARAMLLQAQDPANPTVQQRMSQRLQEVFSDTAVRRCFWALSQLAALRLA